MHRAWCATPSSSCTGPAAPAAQFIGRNFAGELFGPGQPLDAAKYFIILPDDIGHGGSSKPSDGLRAKFPRYGYVDMVKAEYRLITEGLGVDHLRLVMGTSMGGMHTWMWGGMYPDFMDALMPLASLPTQIAGRNRAWRRVVIDAIRNDPEWKNGDYTTQPQSLRIAAQMLWLVGSNPIRRQTEAPTVADADRVLDAYVANYMKTGDANNILYALESSRDYDPGPALEKITAPLVAINSADDIINPPELQILEREIKRVPEGPRDRPAAERPHRRSRHAYARGVVEGAPGRAAGGDGTLTVGRAAPKSAGLKPCATRPSRHGVAQPFRAALIVTPSAGRSAGQRTPARLAGTTAASTVTTSSTRTPPVNATPSIALTLSK